MLRNIILEMKLSALLLIGVLFIAGLTGCGRAHLRHEIPPVKEVKAVPSQGVLQKQNIRVALAKNAKRISVSANRPVRIYDMRTRKKIGDLQLTHDAQIAIRDGRLLINGKFMDSQRVRLVGDKQDTIRVQNHAYRGQLEIGINPEKGGVLVVNYIPLEDYLRGVVPNEVQANWPAAALQAQAVAARTFAYYKMSGRSQQLYDLDATVNSQVYGGHDSERPSTDQAVSETQGQVMRYQGKLIAAFYHSNCGGHTANVRDVWGGSMDYLGGASCGFCDEGPHAEWEINIPVKELAAQLRKKGLAVGDVRNLNLSGRDESGRVLQVQVVHSKGETAVKAPAFRLMVGADKLRSTRFNVSMDGKTFRFWGKGWGHGVGLCQEGSLGMAKSGFGYRDILGHYYPGVDIVRVAE